LFGSCIIHILYRECAEIKKKKNNSGAKGLSSCENKRLWSGYHAEGRAIAGVCITLFSGAIFVMMTIMIMTTVWYETGYSLRKQSIRHDTGYTCFTDSQKVLYNTFLSTSSVIHFFFHWLPLNIISELQFTANNVLISIKVS